MMICKIARNEGFICKFLLTYLSVVYCASVGENSQTIQELCVSNNYIYTLKAGETQQFKLTSVGSRGDVNKWHQKSKRKCFKEFKTNSGAAHINVAISNMSVPSCSEKCQCNYFTIAEPGYNDTFCGVNKQEINFESRSNYLFIDFHHEHSMLFEVTLTFTVKRNTYIITGSPRTDGHKSGQFLETPYFPREYKSYYTSEYILRSNDERGHVMLMFVDFQIDSSSYIEVVGHNGTHPVVLYGNIFRPPVFVSGKNELSLKFEANNRSNIGFRAVCFFLNDSDLKDYVPYSDCGGRVRVEAGGSITLVHAKNHNYYDCIWHLSLSMLPGSNLFLLSVSNFTFENIGPNATLEFREGLNSKSKLVQSIDWNGLNSSDIPAEITVPALTGLYIRFNGILNSHTLIKMIYITYFNGNCSENHLSCNGRCLSSTLRCDGIVHCFNGTDEEDCETTEVVKTTHPTVTRSEVRNQKAAVLYVFLSIGILGIIVVILVIIWLLYRRHKAEPHVVENVEQPQVINEMTGPIPIPCHPRVSMYSDQPPSYEDFLRSSEDYPPPLYTRAAKRHSEPFPIYNRVHHTTSFCGKEAIKQRMVHSFDLHSLNSSHSDENSGAESELFAEPGCSFGRTNAEWVINNQLPNSSCGLKRTTSFNSVLDKKTNAADCHFHLSITHSICPHLSHQTPDIQYQSLPTNLKISDRNPNAIDITFQTSLPEVQYLKRIGFSSCIFCYKTLSVKSEMLTTVKARCHSDPCRRVSFSCSVHGKS